MPRLTIRYRLTPLDAPLLSPKAAQDDAVKEAKEARGRLFCGAGAGRYGVDQVAIRDGSGMPYIPGSTLKGIVREKYLELCRAAGLQVQRRKDPAGRPTHLHTHPMVDDVFGAPAYSQDAPGPAHRDLQSVFTDLSLESETPVAFAQVQKRVRMDRRLGRPADKSLFDVEYSVCGPFQGAIWLWRDKHPNEDPAVAMLLGALRLVRSIGGHRSTGAGLFQIDLLSGQWKGQALSQDDWKQIMQQIGSIKSE